jgi:stress-induced morphogen
VSEKISKALSPVAFEIINESKMHGGYFEGKESHFKLVVVSEEFEGLPLIKRHRLVNTLLAEELAEDIHALSLVTKTPQQWEANSTVSKSPSCLGGSQSNTSTGDKEEEK